MEKRYLGDGVYAETLTDRGLLRLTTEDGRSVTNDIFLESEVIINLLRYMQESGVDFKRFLTA